MRETMNKKPIMINQGSCYLDGKKIYDAVKLKVIFTPDVSSGKVLGDKTANTRWKGTYAITAEMTQRRATRWLKEVVKKYIKNGITPEFTISGALEDKDSDYYAEYGRETVTVVGCVLTSAINLLELDADGEFLEDALTFNCKDVKSL